jgi:hypothetical protein
MLSPATTVFLQGGEDFYREAIGCLERTRVQQAQARTHDLFGEWIETVPMHNEMGASFISRQGATASEGAAGSPMPTATSDARAEQAPAARRASQVGADVPQQKKRNDRHRPQHRHPHHGTEV